MLPLFVRGLVSHGFGRGSKQLGIPTANFSDDVVDNLPSSIPNGIYFGWASVRPTNGVQLLNGADHVAVYPSVASIGWNPFFKDAERNTKRTLEVHIIHQFPSDFYGAELRFCLAGYIRDQLDFKSKDDLIGAIRKDIQFANEHLQEPRQEILRSHDFFLSSKPPTFLKGIGNEKADHHHHNGLGKPSEPCGCVRHDD